MKFKDGTFKRFTMRGKTIGGGAPAEKRGNSGLLKVGSQNKRGQSLMDQGERERLGEETS